MEERTQYAENFARPEFGSQAEWYKLCWYYQCRLCEQALRHALADCSPCKHALPGKKRAFGRGSFSFPDFGRRSSLWTHQLNALYLLYLVNCNSKTRINSAEFFSARTPIPLRTWSWFLMRHLSVKWRPCTVQANKKTIKGQWNLQVSHCRLVQMKHCRQNLLLKPMIAVCLQPTENPLDPAEWVLRTPFTMGSFAGKEAPCNSANLQLCLDALNKNGLQALAIHHPKAVSFQADELCTPFGNRLSRQQGLGYFKLPCEHHGWVGCPGCNSWQCRAKSFFDVLWRGRWQTVS